MVNFMALDNPEVQMDKRHQFPESPMQGEVGGASQLLRSREPDCSEIGSLIESGEWYKYSYPS